MGLYPKYKYKFLGVAVRSSTKLYLVFPSHYLNISRYNRYGN